MRGGNAALRFRSAIQRPADNPWRQRAKNGMTTGTFTGTPPEFLVLLCPLVYPGVTMCPASIGDAVKMWCFRRLRGLLGRFDSPRLQLFGPYPNRRFWPVTTDSAEAYVDLDLTTRGKHSVNPWPFLGAAGILLRGLDTQR